MVEWLPQCYGDADDPKLAAFATTEPQAGSDVGAMRTRLATTSADEWVLNGQKAYITNGGIANVHVVTAVVEPELGSRGQAAFVVRPGPGPAGRQEAAQARAARLTHGRRLPRRRARARFVPAGRQGQARRTSRPAREGGASSGQAAMRTFEISRPTVGAQALGIARAAYEYDPRLRQGPRRLRRPIIENQAIAFALADMRTEIDAARLLVWRASWMGAPTSRSRRPRAR